MSNYEMDPLIQIFSFVNPHSQKYIVNETLYTVEIFPTAGKLLLDRLSECDLR